MRPFVELRLSVEESARFKLSEAWISSVESMDRDEAVIAVSSKLAELEEIAMELADRRSL